jgi:hypothetical protein
VIVPGKEHRLEKDREDAENYGCPARSPPRPHNPNPREETQMHVGFTAPCQHSASRAAVSDSDRGVLFMIYYNNKVWTPANPFRG